MKKTGVKCVDKAFLEITNVCNLSCTFCHGTKREKGFMSREDFDLLTDRLAGRVKYLYFHLMGEPLLHPLLPEFIALAKDKGFLPMLTTNGTLLKKREGELLSCLPYKISISVHAPGANPVFEDPDYLESCISFAGKASLGGCITVLRLWNLDSGREGENGGIISALEKHFPRPWQDIRGGESVKLGERLFIEWGREFAWPDMSLDEFSGEVFCYGLRDQIGIHVSGNVVPCCLDAEGDIVLGNLFDSEFDDILNSKRARDIYAGFGKRQATEPLCKRCGYAKRFSKKC